MMTSINTNEEPLSKKLSGKYLNILAIRDIDALKELHANGLPLNAQVLNIAVSYGSFFIIDWLIKMNTPWDIWTTRVAIINNESTLFYILLDRYIPIDNVSSQLYNLYNKYRTPSNDISKCSSFCTDEIEEIHLATIKYAHEHSCRISHYSYWVAKRFNHRKVLSYIHSERTGNAYASMKRRCTKGKCDFCRINIVWQLWDADDCYLQWPPEEVISDILAYL